ncbi:MAG: O-antigen ligase family protein [Bryobacteraceae bacterium]
MNGTARSFSPTAGVLVLSIAFGVFGALLIEIFGVKASVIFPALLIAPFAFPVLGKQSLTRFRNLWKQLSWWHGLWFLVFLSGLVFRFRDSQAISDSAVDFWALYRIGLMGITGSALAMRFFLRRSPLQISLFRGLIGRLLIYALVCVCSTVWSAYPAWTFYKSLEYLVVVVLLAAVLATLASAASYKSVLDLMWTIDGLLLISIWIGALIWPADALQSSAGLISVQLQGVVPQVADNGVGHVSAILSVVALSRLLRRPQTKGSRFFYVVLFAITVGTMILAQTRSAILGFLLGVSLLLYFSRQIGLIACLATIVLLLYLATGAGGLFEEYMRRGQNAGEVASLSGRIDWWDFGWNEFVKHPSTGMGAFTARFTVLAKFGDQGTSTVHNTYLEALLGVGIIGLIPLFTVLLGTWTSLIRELRHSSRSPARRQLALEATAVLGVITLRSFFSVGLIVHYDLDFMAILGFAELLRRLPERVTVPSNSHLIRHDDVRFIAETHNGPIS